MTTTKEKRMTPEQAKDKLVQLNDEAAEAAAAYRAAKERKSSAHAWDAVLDATAPLRDAHVKNIFRGGPDPDEARRLTLDFIRHIEDEGLVIEPIDPYAPAAGVRVVDPRPVGALMTAEAESRRAARARDDFAREHAALLREHEDRQLMDRVQAALRNGSPSEFAAAIRNLPDPAEERPTALRTEDITPEGVR